MGVGSKTQEEIRTGKYQQCQGEKYKTEEVPEAPDATDGQRDLKHLLAGILHGSLKKQGAGKTMLTGKTGEIGIRATIR